MHGKMYTSKKLESLPITVDEHAVENRLNRQSVYMVDMFAFVIFLHLLHAGALALTCSTHSHSNRLPLDLSVL